MRPRLLLTINWKFAVDFFARGLHTRTAVARLPWRQLGFLVSWARMDRLTLGAVPLGGGRDAGRRFYCFIHTVASEPLALVPIEKAC